MITIRLNLIQSRVANEGNTTTTYAILKDAQGVAYIVREAAVKYYNKEG